MIANAEVTGSGQGFLTFTLAIIGFIFKKMLLAFTDPIWLESAMLIAGARTPAVRPLECVHARVRTVK